MNLKQLIKLHKIKQSDMARACGVSPTVINQLINHDMLPKKEPQTLLQKVEAYLTERNVTIPNDLFNSEDEEDFSMNKELLTKSAKQTFNIFRDPFTDDVQEHGDVFLTQDSRYIRETLYQAAKSGGFVAVIGESGAGKSVLRRDLIDRVNREEADIKIIMPSFPDKSKMTVASLIEAIIDELNPDVSVKRSLEAKSRQMERMLRDSSRAGMSHCIVIEESHDLTLPMLKNLKRFWELEDGFKRLLSIVLIGQPELKSKLDERRNYEAREVIRRIEIAELQPLGTNLGKYINHKFERIGVDSTKFFAEDAVDALNERLIFTGNNRKSISMSYPLVVNNYLTKILNYAAEIGATAIDADIVRSV